MESMSFAEYIKILGRGKKGSRSLNFEESRAAMGMIMQGHVEPVQLGAFLMLLRVKEETGEEIAGFVQAIRERLEKAPTSSIDIDWPSYAGKRRQLPWFILAAKALADSGHKILMHGSEGHTSNRVYTREVFESLSLPVVSSFQDAVNELGVRNLAYLPLKNYCPTLHNIIELRPLLGLRSPVHTVSRMLNPLNATHSLQGIFHPPYLDTHLDAAQILGDQSILVIKGEAGEFEVNPDMDTSYRSLVNNQAQTDTWPRYFQGSRHAKETQLKIVQLRQLWQDEINHPYGFAAVIETIALIIFHMRGELTVEDAKQEAGHIWQNRGSL